MVAARTSLKEPELIRESCLHLVGAVAHAGELFLTPSSLCFRPTRRIEKMLGAREHSIPLNTVSSVEYGGINRLLTVQCGASIYKFLGPGAYRVYLRLKAHMDHLAGRENKAFQPGEQVLVSGPIYRLIVGSIGAYGDLLLTDRRLAFISGPGIERRLWSDQSVEVALADIRNVDIVGVRRRLQLQVRNDVIRFGGGLAPRMYAVLTTLGIGASEEDSGRKVLGSIGARFQTGVLHSQGTLIISRHRLHFEPTNRMDAAVGIKGVKIPLHSITWFRVVGWLDRRLVINTLDNNYTFYVDDVPRLFLDLAPLIAAALGPDEPAPTNDGTLTEADGTLMFNWWRSRLKSDAQERLVMATGAIQWVRQWWVRRGWILLTERHLYFVPAGPPRDNAFPLILPLSEVKQRTNVESDNRRLVFSRAGRVRVFTPNCGQLLNERFWLMARRSQGDDGQWDGDVQSLIGLVPFVQIVRNDRVITNLRPARLTTHEDGMGLFYPGQVPLELVKGAKVSLRVGSDKGICVIEGEIVTVQSIVQRSEGGGEINLLAIAHAPGITVINRRKSFRVRVTAACQVRLMTYQPQEGWKLTSRVLRATLQDLSVGGARFITNVEVSPKSRILLRLPPRDAPIEVESLVLDCQKGKTEKEWQLRVSFVAQKSSVVDRLNELVLTYQREMTETA